MGKDGKKGKRGSCIGIGKEGGKRKEKDKEKGARLEEAKLRIILEERGKPKLDQREGKKGKKRPQG